MASVNFVTDQTVQPTVTGSVNILMIVGLILVQRKLIASVICLRVLLTMDGFLNRQHCQNFKLCVLINQTRDTASYTPLFYLLICGFLRMELVGLPLVALQGWHRGA